MKAALLTGIRKVEVCQVPQPAIEHDGQVLVKVETVGVCGSDMHYYRNGRIGSQVIKFPWSVGHECAGTVAGVGPGVKRLKTGDRIAVDPLIPCLVCDQCVAGFENTCRNQKFLGCPGQAPGALAEYLVMPEHCCIGIPQNLTMTQATLVEPFAIALHAQRLFAGACTARHPRVAILGAGPIGLSVLAAMKAAGDCTIYMTEIRANRLALAARSGTDWVGDPNKQDVRADIAKLSPLGLDAVFECAGQQETLDLAADLLAPRGMLVLAGIPEGDRISFSPDALRRKELRLQNVRRQNACTVDAIELVSMGKVNLDAMVTHEFTLDQAAEAFEIVADYRDNVVKAMIHLHR